MRTSVVGSQFRNFPQFFRDFLLLVPLACLLVPCVCPVQRCCCLTLREVWLPHRNFLQFFATGFDAP